MIDISIPGDKSISHRALMFSVLAQGESRVRGLLRSAEVQAAAHCLRMLSAELPEYSNDMQIRGRGLRGLSATDAKLDCANSGTTARLFMGIVAGQGIS